jgi:hypothetical protein
MWTYLTLDYFVPVMKVNYAPEMVDGKYQYIVSECKQSDFMG